jgi:hypothetical protein
MGITVSTSPQQVTASVSEDKITAAVSSQAVTATVQAGFGASGAAGSPGASGSSGVVTVSAPLTNSGTGSAAALALSLGSGLDVSAGSLVVSAVPLSSLAQGGATAGQVVRWNGTAWAVGNVTAGSTVWDDIIGKPTFATVATTGSYADLTGKPTLGTLASQDGTFSGTSSGTNTGDQTITLTGDVTGSGTGSFAATLSSTGVSAGTYTSVTVDAKGRVTAGSSPAIAYSSLSGVPSTFAPSSHKTSHATGGTDALTAADIGAAATSHSHAASDITSGTLADARLSEKATAAINSYLWQTFR